MNSLFESFCKLIDEIPDSAVLRTVDVERRMLQNDLAERRISSESAEAIDAKSLLTFCNFVSYGWSVEGQVQYLPPIDHLAYYRRVLERLIDSGMLPYDAKETFDRTYSRAFMRELSSQ